MKKIVATALMLAAAVAGAKGYKEWFTPKNGWTGQTVPVNIQFSTVDWTGKVPVTVTLNDALNLLDSVITQDVPPSAKNAFSLSKAALANSIFAACQAQMNKVKIDNLGAAFEGVFVSTYGKYVCEQIRTVSGCGWKCYNKGEERNRHICVAATVDSEQERRRFGRTGGWR